MKRNRKTGAAGPGWALPCFLGARVRPTSNQHPDALDQRGDTADQAHPETNEDEEPGDDEALAGGRRVEGGARKLGSPRREAARCVISAHKSRRIASPDEPNRAEES